MQLEPHESLERKNSMKIGRVHKWSGKVRAFPMFPKQPEFQISLTCSPVSVPPQIPVGSPATLWLICWSFMHSLCCNCCSLVASAFHVPFMFIWPQRKWSGGPSCIGKTEKHPGQMWDALPRWAAQWPVLRGGEGGGADVVFESPASPTVLYQLSLTGNMSGPYLRGDWSRVEGKKRRTNRDLQPDLRWKRNKLSKLCLKMMVPK